MIDKWYEMMFWACEMMVFKEFQGKFRVMVISVYALT